MTVGVSWRPRPTVASRPRATPYVRPSLMAGAAVPRLLERQAVIFDMDGVVVDTAGLYAAAWAELFDVALAPPGLRQPAADPFDPNLERRRCFNRRGRDNGVRTVPVARVLPSLLNRQSRKREIAGLGHRKLAAAAAAGLFDRGLPS